MAWSVGNCQTVSCSESMGEACREKPAEGRRTCCHHEARGQAQLAVRARHGERGDVAVHLSRVLLPDRWVRPQLDGAESVGAAQVR